MAFRYFVWGEREDEVVSDENDKSSEHQLLKFRIKLGEELVSNPFLPYDDELEQNGEGTVCNRRSTRIRIELAHDYTAAPRFAKNSLMENGF